MSCVVALRPAAGPIIVGADSAATGDDGSIENRTNPKVFARGNAVIGCTNSYRAMQVIQHTLAIPKRPDAMKLERYMATKFVNSLYSCLKVARCLPKDDEMNKDNQFLVAFEGRIFRIDSDYSIAEVTTRWDAIGSGGEVARAALLAQDLVAPSLPNYAARTRVTDALSVAEQLTNAVRRPFVLVTAR